MENLQEIWKDVPGFEGRYKVSNYGRIASIFERKCALLQPSLDSAGYYNVSLRHRKVGIRRKCIRVHQLVAGAFLQKPETTGRVEIDHRDCNKLNNRLGNLQYMTVLEHRRATITKGEVNKKGELHPMHKLKEVDVLEIRRLYKLGLTQKKIAGVYGVSRRHVSDIVNLVNWSWLQPDSGSSMAA